MIGKELRIPKLAIVVVLALLVFPALSAQASSLGAIADFDNPPDLFSDAGPPADFDLVDDPSNSRTRYVNVDFGLLSQETFTLNLFDDVSYVAVLDRIAGNATGNFTWVGHLEDSEHSRVTLVVKNGSVLVGNIAASGGDSRLDTPPAAFTLSIR